jgi:hypothetical protein
VYSEKSFESYTRRETMRKLVFLTMAAFLLSTILFLPAGAAQTAQKPMASNAGQMAHPDRDPEIHEAMKALETAKRHLEGAQHDFGGHRVKALEHVNQAIDQLKEALNWQKEHQK